MANSAGLSWFTSFSMFAALVEIERGLARGRRNEKEEGIRANETEEVSWAELGVSETLFGALFCDRNTLNIFADLS